MVYADSAAPDHTAPEGAVWLWSTLYSTSLRLIKLCLWDVFVFSFLIQFKWVPTTYAFIMKEVYKKDTGCNLKTTEFLDCGLNIGVCAVISLNTVFVIQLRCTGNLTANLWCQISSWKNGIISVFEIKTITPRNLTHLWNSKLVNENVRKDFNHNKKDLDHNLRKHIVWHVYPI